VNRYRPSVQSDPLSLRDLRSRAHARLPERSILFKISPVLTPTTDFSHPDLRPYFLWWTKATVGELRKSLASDNIEERAYWMGALLREANTRDVWAFVTPSMIRGLWPHLIRHLGRSRAMWAYLLGLPEPRWPPDEAHAQ
ncbi:MAG: hypothetical protein ACT4TC_06925, partial [Myxococcaceae bacterium]